jgi:hypothetical protein
MAWGYGTTVEDTEVYEGQPDTDVGQNEFDLSSGLVGQEPVTIDEYVSASSSGSVTINEQRLADKISFYLDESEFGLTYTDDPLSAKFGITQGGNTNWEAQVGGGTGLLNANVGIAGQGTSGHITPWGNLSTSPLQGLTFSVGAQKNPGMNFNLVGPSVSYGQQFNTPIGPLDFNVDKSYGGPWSGSLRYQKDW